MKKVTIFNTWITSENTGDKIIMEACYEIINEILSDAIFVEIPTHSKISFNSHKINQGSNFGIVCGSNLFKTNILIKKAWKVRLFDLIFIKDSIFLGVGAQSYSKPINLINKLYWRRILNKNYIHSVRDEYTKNKLEEIGITNVINTACPTMWNLTKEHCNEIPKKKSKYVVTTLTNYNKNIDCDLKMLKILSAQYEQVYLWPQSYEDILYIKDIKLSEDIKNINIINPNLESFNKILNLNIDYVGTRLHAGIRALQKKKRTIIIGIDNRAIEKEKFGLLVIKRENIDELESLLNSEFKTDIKLPIENIEKWKSQFKKEVTSIKIHIFFRFINKIKLIYKKFRRRKNG